MVKSLIIVEGPYLILPLVSLNMHILICPPRGAHILEIVSDTFRLVFHIKNLFSRLQHIANNSNLLLVDDESQSILLINHIYE